MYRRNSLGGAWRDVCKEKEEGALGVKNLWAFNFALLGK